MAASARTLVVIGSLLLACTSPAPSSSTTGGDPPVVPDEPQTKCESDDDCRLSCIEAGNCCAEPPFCDEARHWDDHAKIEATRTNCADFDYQTCPQPDHTVPDEVAIPECRRHRCVAKKIKREPPPAPIDVGGYDRTCKADADCIVVHTQPCAKCGCGQHTIAAGEKARFDEAIGAVKCPAYDPWPNIDCGDCMSPTARCDQGQCTTGR